MEQASKCLGVWLILGEKTYPDRESIPDPVDVVDVLRLPHECPAYAEQAAAIGADAFWLQLGIVSWKAAGIADEHGSTW